MKLTDMEAIKALHKVRILELEEMVSDYPESDVDGRTDWEMIANEAGWLLDMYDSYETSHHEDLEESRLVLSRTRYGTIPALTYSGKCYTDLEVQTAKRTVNEYNRLVRFVARLKKRGLCVPNY